MKMYNAAVEVDTKDAGEDYVDALMGMLAQYHAAVGTSARGWLEVRISLPAESLIQACTTGAAVVELASGRTAIACEVMTEEEFDAREGFVPEPDLVSAAQAAELLGVSRQRVYQLEHAGKLQAVPIGERGRGFTRSSVDALAGQTRTAGRPATSRA